jgi:hypothetical protein
VQVAECEAGIEAQKLVVAAAQKALNMCLKKHAVRGSHACGTAKLLCSAVIMSCLYTLYSVRTLCMRVCCPFCFECSSVHFVLTVRTVHWGTTGRRE